MTRFGLVEKISATLEKRAATARGPPSCRQGVDPHGPENLRVPDEFQLLTWIRQNSPLTISLRVQFGSKADTRKGMGVGMSGGRTLRHLQFERGGLADAMSAEP